MIAFLYMVIIHVNIKYLIKTYFVLWMHFLFSLSQSMNSYFLSIILLFFKTASNISV
jgi:hypothetical protein